MKIKLTPRTVWERVPCSWTEAELIFPGIKTEWEELKHNPGPLRPLPDTLVRLELCRCPHGDELHCIQLDPNKRWDSPPTWIRGSEGWRHPYALPKLSTPFSR